MPEASVQIEELKTLQEALNLYLKAETEGVADSRLKTFLADLRNLLENPKSAMALKQHSPKIIASLALAVTVHVIRKRKHEDLAAHGHGVAALASAFSDNELEWIRRELEELYEVFVEENQIGLSWRTPLAVTLAGFDPRHADQPESVEAEWQARLDGACQAVSANHQPTLPGKPNIFPHYNESKARIYADFHNPAKRYDLLLVDFAWLPELAYLGYVVPLDQRVPNLRDSVRAKLATTGLGPREAQWWASSLAHLARAGNNFFYAFPLFVNFHGALVKQGDSVEALEGANLTGSSVQNAHSACCVYELYAHFAYRGAEPISCKQLRDGRYQVTRIDFDSRSAKRAIADYLVRLYFADAPGNHMHKDVKAFRMDHVAEILSLTSGDAQRAACFSRELAEHPDIKRVFHLAAPHERWNHELRRRVHLSSLGGYGLAVSRQAGDIDLAIDVAAAIFNAFTSEIVSTEHAEWFVTDNDDPDEFLRYHCRPRIPFWSHIEELLSFAVEELYGAMHDVMVNTSEKSFEHLGKIVEDALPAGPLASLKRRIETALSNSGWEDARTPGASV